MNLENTKVQMKKGILEFSILSIISRGEVYSSDILETLKDAKMIVVEGTIYPLLTRLKNSGLLSYNWVESTGGPPRKYFKLTLTGQHFLAELEKTWQELTFAINITTKHNNTKTKKT